MSSEFKTPVGAHVRWISRQGMRPREGVVLAQIHPGISANAVLRALRPEALRFRQAQDVSAYPRYLVEVTVGVFAGAPVYRHMTPFNHTVDRAAEAAAAPEPAPAASPPAKPKRQRRGQ